MLAFTLIFDPTNLPMLTIFTFMSSIYLLIECGQMKKEFADYFKSVYNYFDLIGNLLMITVCVLIFIHGKDAYQYDNIKLIMALAFI